MLPLVSIIVPCYKQAQYLSEALDSVLVQEYIYWECIIINDGSPDNTEEIALDYCNKDSRFKYISQVNKGVSSARNKGIENSNGIYILPLDADDRLSNDYVKQAVLVLESSKDVKVVYCEGELFDKEHGKFQLPSFSIEELAKQNMIFCSALFRKSDWEIHGGYEVDMRFGLEDWEFWINLLKNGGDVVQLPIIGFFYRVRNESRNRSINKEQQEYLFTAMHSKHESFFQTYLENSLSLYYQLQEYKLKLVKSEYELLHIKSSQFFKFSDKIKKCIYFFLNKPEQK